MYNMSTNVKFINLNLIFYNINFINNSIIK